jgi:hypothetical protein
MNSSTILDLGTRWKCVVSFTPLPLFPGEAGGIHWVRGWMGRGAGLVDVEKRISFPCQESDSTRLARSYTDRIFRL